MGEARGQQSMGDSRARTTRSGDRPRGGVSVVGVIGEVLMTAGVVVLLFVVWQLWIGDVIAGAQNNERGRELAQEWQQSPAPSESPSAEPTQEPTAGPIPVAAEAGDGEVFGIMYIPRFGDDYAVQMAGGVTREKTLDPIGIGHYPGTEMPGAVGNTAYAAHRTGYGGAPFLQLAELRVGDPIVIETPDGWYTYRFRNLEYVRPSATAVLSDVPQDTVKADGQRFLTLTTCSPKHTIIERLIAYGVFESFTPRADGPPTEIAATVEAGGA